MDAELLAILACSACGEALREEDDVLRCSECGASYPIEDGVPRLIPDLEDEQWAEWERKQRLGAAEYEREAEPSEQVKELASSFGDFAQLHGRVLDVGCGISARPPYLQAIRGVEYVGVDPLVGIVSRDFAFVQGVGERLPFRTGTFDVVLNATTLDHVPDPAPVLREMRRVTKPDGWIALWVGIVDSRSTVEAMAGEYPIFVRPSRVLARVRSSGLTAAARAAARRAVVHPARRLALHTRARREPRAIIDDIHAERAKYHFNFFTDRDVMQAVVDANLRVEESRILLTPASGMSLFVRATREPGSN